MKRITKWQNIERISENMVEMLYHMIISPYEPTEKDAQHSIQ